MMMKLMMNMFLYIMKKAMQLNTGGLDLIYFTPCTFSSLIMFRFLRVVCSLCRDVPYSIALPIIRPALGRQQSVSDRAKVAMQGYLNHFLENLDIVNSREVRLFALVVFHCDMALP